LKRLERDKISEQLVPTGRHRALENSSMLRSASLPLTISYRFREIVLIFKLSIDEVNNLIQTVTSSDETQRVSFIQSENKTCGAGNSVQSTQPPDYHDP
jgi:hypothetical protein